MSYVAYACSIMEFNLQQEYHTLESEICSKFTNDAGELLLPETTQILLGNFKLTFMSTVLSKMLSHYHSSPQTKSYQDGEQIYYNTCYYLSPQNEQIWNEFILHDFEAYKQMCHIVTGGFVDKDFTP